MNTTGTPRCILADRDVNKPVIKSPSTIKTSPLKPSLKPSPFPINTGMRNYDLEMTPAANPLIFLKSRVAETSNIPAGNKRGIVCLGDVPKGPSLKQVMSDAGNGRPKGIGIIASDEIHERNERTVVEPEIQQRPRESLSPDSSFNTSLDYWNEDSQNTTLTEPDLVPLDNPTFTTVHILGGRLISPQEARENARALRLRLKMAMYKIETNQTDLPLSRVQIRQSNPPLRLASKLPLYHNPYNQSQSKSTTRRPLPTVRPVSTSVRTIHENSFDTNVHITQSSQDKNIFGNPIKEGLRAASQNSDSISHIYKPTAIADKEEYGRHLLHANQEAEEEGEGEGRNDQNTAVTNNVVKGSAADGLLSLSARATLELMGCN